MGCDIHNHIEYLKDIYVGDDKDGKSQYKPTWVCGDYFKVNPYYKENQKDNEWKEEPLELVGFCDNRNYGLFALLADVRNYSHNKPITKPKGLPNDLSKEVKADAERWGCDGHSHSYFTLKELLDYQKNQPKLKLSGMIPPQAAKELDENGTAPKMWCQFTTIKDWVYREWEEEDKSLDNLIDAMKKRAHELYVIYGWWWDEKPEEAYNEANKIRLVFWFDN